MVPASASSSNKEEEALVKGSCSLPSAPKGSRESSGSRAGGDPDGAVPLGAGTEDTYARAVGGAVGIAVGAGADVGAGTNESGDGATADGVDVSGGGTSAAGRGGTKVAEATDVAAECDPWLRPWL